MNSRKILLLASALMICFCTAYSQEDSGVKPERERVKAEKPEKERGKFGSYISRIRAEKKARDPFSSGMLLEHQTFVSYKAKTLEFVMQHRFGNLNSENFDLAGIYGASNIRLGLNYSITDRFMVGVGTSKNLLIQDFQWKLALLQQTRSKAIPIALTYYGNIAVEAGRKENYAIAAHRVSYYHQLILGRKFHKLFSAQAHFGYAHFNVVDSSSFIPEGEMTAVNHDMKHDNFSVGLSGRVKVAKQISVIFQYDQPLTLPDNDKANPNVALGIEIATSSHAFQLFAGSYKSLSPQRNMVFNQNDFTEWDILLGFNITRLWSF